MGTFKCSFLLLYMFACFALFVWADEANHGFFPSPGGPCALDFALSRRMDNHRPGITIFDDPVYGRVEISTRLMTVVDTPEFQALRRIKQLGTCHHIFPGAVHTRFEHSLGVCHLANRFMQFLRRRRPELGITAEHIETVQLALLTHDWGHSAYSHLFDQDLAVDFVPVHLREHEIRSVEILRHVARAYVLPFTERQIVMAGRMILGQWNMTSIYATPLWMYQIVHDPFHGVDLDKLDYLMRDTIHLGLPLNLIPDMCEVMHHMTALPAITATTPSAGLGLHHDASSREKLFRYRAHLFRTVYRHPIVVQLDHVTTYQLRAVAIYQGWSNWFRNDTAAWRLLIDDDSLKLYSTLPSEFLRHYALSVQG